MTSDFYTGIITAVDDATDTITVASWISAGVAGTPAANSVIRVRTLQSASQVWMWDPAGQGNNLIGLRDGPYYLWLAATFSSNLASGTFDAKTTVVKAYGLRIQD